MQEVSLKPGWKTSEFAVVLVTQIITILVLVGVIPAQDQTMLTTSVTEIVAAMTTVIANAVVVWKYIQERTTLKTSLSLPVEEKPKAYIPTPS